MLNMIEKAAKIRCLILDVDGVLTDGKLYFNEQGEVAKAFSVQDGLGIKLLQQVGITVAIISGRNSPIVQRRAEELAITHIYQGQENKLPALELLLIKLCLTHEQCAFVGDDLPDLPIIQCVGLGIAVANAVAVVKQHALWQTQRSGGEGAVREVCDFLIEAQK
ncbi:3-deoxy-manno-octulosonate-8-phosphatase KdsC [soil metagenome]